MASKVWLIPELPIVCPIKCCNLRIKSKPSKALKVCLLFLLLLPTLLLLCERQRQQQQILQQ